ncbi:FCD domain-containing protein [Rubrobacter marinus]|uniref:FCD domain-containing protein n=1 Tax=Rubrobacter marinus TaxID=2653852 RepID=A0A6G8PYN3_9ACTN|nr:FCD domain-containing protein [Rubrobacter marinus]QIN79321.1 FCD domain-containing protein [Rubrobacter marinus]
MREAIEVPAAGMAALPHTPEAPGAMKETMGLDGLKDSHSLVADVSFHRAVAAASGNRLLSVFIDSVYLAAGRLYSEAIPGRGPGETSAGTEQEGAQESDRPN